MTTRTSRKPADMLRAMVRIRAFKQHLPTLPGAGFQHLSSGDEAVAVGTCAVLEPGDQLIISGRSLGPALARGAAARDVIADLLDQPVAPTRKAVPATRAVAAGDLSAAVGAALAQQQAGRDGVVVWMLGAGACSAAQLHETLALAAQWKLPLVVVGNSHPSASRHAPDAAAVDDLAGLARPFPIFTRTVDGMNVLTVRNALDEAVAYARDGRGPAFVDCVSCRFYPEETETSRARCPIETLAAGFGLELELEAARLEARREMTEAIRAARSVPATLSEQPLARAAA